MLRPNHFGLGRSPSSRSLGADRSETCERGQPSYIAAQYKSTDQGHSVIERFGAGSRGVECRISDGQRVNLRRFGPSEGSSRISRPLGHLALPTISAAWHDLTIKLRSRNISLRPIKVPGPQGVGWFTGSFTPEHLCLITGCHYATTSGLVQSIPSSIPSNSLSSCGPGG